MRRDAQEGRNGHSAGVHPSEDARGLAGAGEGEKHPRACVEAGVGHREHGGQEDCIDHMGCCAEPCALKDDRQWRCCDVGICEGMEVIVRIGRLRL